jgi:hypothetical protein
MDENLHGLEIVGVQSLPKKNTVTSVQFRVSVFVATYRSSWSMV